MQFDRLWLGMTLAFEFLFGHYIAGKSWSLLLADYNLAAGRLWVSEFLQQGEGTERRPCWRAGFAAADLDEAAVTAFDVASLRWALSCFASIRTAIRSPPPRS